MNDWAARGVIRQRVRVVVAVQNVQRYLEIQRDLVLDAFDFGRIHAGRLGIVRHGACGGVKGKVFCNEALVRQHGIVVRLRREYVASGHQAGIILEAKKIVGRMSAVLQ